MDLSSFRTAYCIGNYERANSIAQDLIASQAAKENLTNYCEFVSIYWKSIIKESGDVSKAAQCIQVLPVPELVKKSLIIWSKVYKSHNSNNNSVTSPSSSDIMTLQEISSKAYEAVELEVEARDQIILTCAESLLILSAVPETFSLLKLVKASNLDCQVMYIEILLKLGQHQMARNRLKKMKNIPEWTEDVRFLLSEASIALSDTAQDANEAGVEATDEGLVFGVKDALYSYQELVQVHGPTTMLLCGLAASFALLGKFTDSEAILAQAARLAPNDATVQANILALSILTNNPSAPSVKDFKTKFPKHLLSVLL